MKDWERAGCPHILKAVENEYKYIGAYIRENPELSVRTTV